MGANSRFWWSSLVLLVGLPSCTGEGGSRDQALDIHTVQRGDLRIAVRELGEIQAARNTRVASQLEGRSTLIYLIPEGTIVKEGDKLAELDVSGIEDRRSTQAINVAKADAALEQAQKSLEIMERQLEADLEAAASRLIIAEMRRDKFMGRAIRIPRAVEGGSTAGTNAQMVTKLRELLEGELLGNAMSEVNYADLVNEVMEIFEGEENLALEMGEMANQVLRQIEQIAQAQAKLALDEDTYTHSKNLHAKEFITRNEMERDKLTYDGQSSNVMLAWNDLELLIRFTLKENKISLRQDVRNAVLDLASVEATNQATRVRENAELISKEAEFELAAERLSNWDTQIANAVIRAPTPGLVVYPQEGGGMGRARDPIMEGMDVRERQALIMLPDVTTMVAELKVHEAQVNKVTLGQPATIQIDALPERVFTGRVTRVAPLPDSGSMFMNNDLKVYKTTVTLDGKNEDGLLRPGLTATVEIHVGVLEDVLTVPLHALERQGEVQYVWTVTPGGPNATRIEVGINNMTHVHVLSGLEEGDRIYLAPPAGAELPEFEQPADAEGSVIQMPILSGAGVPVDAGLGRRGSDSRTPAVGTRGGGMGGMAGMMGAGSMQFLDDLREVLTDELPEYRDQLADERGWFRLLRDPAFQADMNRALESHPALRAQIQGMQGMLRGMGGGGRGRGRDGGRQDADRGGRGPGRRGGQP